MTDNELKQIARGLIWDEIDKKAASDLFWSDATN